MTYFFVTTALKPVQRRSKLEMNDAELCTLIV